MLKSWLLQLWEKPKLILWTSSWPWMWAVHVNAGKYFWKVQFPAYFCSQRRIFLFGNSRLEIELSRNEYGWHCKGICSVSGEEGGRRMPPISLSALGTIDSLLATSTSEGGIHNCWYNKYKMRWQKVEWELLLLLWNQHFSVFLANMSLISRQNIRFSRFWHWYEYSGYLNV